MPLMAAPTPIYGIFDTLFSKITVTFNTHTNTPDPGPRCGAILAAETLALLGESPSCTWAHSKVLIVFVGAGFKFDFANSLVFKAGALTTPGGVTNSRYELPVQPPAELPPVSAEVNGPEYVGACDATFRLDVGATSGAAGKPLEFGWGLHSYWPTNNNRSTNTTTPANLERFLSATNGTSASIPGVALRVGYSYRFYVNLTSWVNGTSKSFVDVKKVGNAVPRLLLPSPNRLSVKMSEPLEIRVQVRPPACSQYNAASLVSRGEWSQTGGPPVAIQNPGSVYLTVPAFALQLGRTYAFTIKAWTVDDSLQVVGTVNSTFSVQVYEEPPVATIAGGSYRAAPVPQGSAPYWITFDASASKDPVYTQAMNFTWSIFEVNATGAPETLGSNATLATVAGPVLRLSTLRLRANTNFSVRVRVTAANNRTATAAQGVVALAERVPIVDISFGTITAKVNPGDKVVLRARVANRSSNPAASGVTWAWRCASNNIDMGDRQLFGTPSNGAQFIVAAGVLAKGATYEFVVSATDGVSSTTGRSLVGFAAVVINVNAPPGLGVCSSSPPSGVAAMTQFRLGCSGWEDVDTPLAYQFMRLKMRGKIDALYLKVCEKRLLPYFETVLPAPENQEKKSITVRSIITDFLGAATEYDFLVNVTQFEDVGPVLREMSERRKEGDTQAYAATFGGVATKLKQLSSNVSYVAAERETLVDSLDKMLQSSQDLGEMGAALIEEATDFENRAEITEKTQEVAIRILGNITANTTTPLPKGALVAGVAAVGNILAAATPANTSIYAPRVERTDPDHSLGLSTPKAQRLEKVLTNFATILGNSLEVDEDPATARAAAVSPDGPSVYLTSVMSKGLSKPRNVSCGEGTDASVVIPPVDGTDPEALSQVSVVYIDKGNMYPPYRRAPLTPISPPNARSGILMLEVRDPSSGSVIPVRNNTKPFRYTVPGRDDNSSFSFVDGYDAEPICLYWNQEKGNWTSDGLTAVSVAPDGGITCDSSHLTSFHSQTRFRLRINVVKPYDITDIRAYDPSRNKMMAFLLGLLGCFTLVFLFASKLDEQDRIDDVDRVEEVNFWRLANRARRYKISDRSHKNFRESLAIAMRRRHPWFSILAHPVGDYMNKRKRLIILLVLIINSGVTCLLLLGQKQQLPFISGNASTAFFAMLIGFPIPFTVALLFERSTPREYRLRVARQSMFASLAGCLFIIGGICFQDMLLSGGDNDDEDNGDNEGDVDGVNDEKDGGGGNEEDAGQEEEERAQKEEEEEEEEDMAAALGINVAAAQELGPTVAASAGGGMGLYVGMSITRGVRKSLARSKKVAGMGHGGVGPKKHFTLAEKARQEGRDLHGFFVHDFDEEKEAERKKKLHFQRLNSLGLDDRKRRHEGVKTSHFARPITHMVALRAPNKAFCGCCGLKSSHDQHLSVYDWTFSDGLGVLISGIAVIGGSLLIAVLSWRFRDERDDAVQSSVYSMAQDIVFRIMTITVVEYALVAPIALGCFGVACFGSSSDEKEKAKGRAPEESVVSEVSSDVLPEECVDLEIHCDIPAFRYDQHGVVQQVTAIGHRDGVRVGMEIVEVNGERCHRNPKVIRHKLREAHLISHMYHAKFRVLSHGKVENEKKTHLKRIADRYFEGLMLDNDEESDSWITSSDTEAEPGEYTHHHHHHHGGVYPVSAGGRSSRPSTSRPRSRSRRPGSRYGDGKRSSRPVSRATQEKRRKAAELARLRELGVLESDSDSADGRVLGPGIADHGGGVQTMSVNHAPDAILQSRADVEDSNDLPSELAMPSEMSMPSELMVSEAELGRSEMGGQVMTVGGSGAGLLDSVPGIVGIGGSGNAAASSTSNAPGDSSESQSGGTGRRRIHI